MNKTEILLMMQYETPTIPLEKICTAYFGCSKQTAKNKAKAGTLPVVAFRMGVSQKAPWLVHASDLAEYVDQLRTDAKSEWVGS